MQDEETGSLSETGAAPGEGLAARVLDMMLSAHVTLEEFSGMLGCSKNSIWRLRSAKSQSVDLELLGAISKWAKREGYSLEWLFLGEGPPKATPAARRELEIHGSISNQMGIIISLGMMAREIGIDLADMSTRWGAEMLSGEVPKIDGPGLMRRVEAFFKEKKK